MIVNDLSLDFVNESFYECGGKVCRKDSVRCSNWIDKNGYYILKFKTKQYKVHRILWILYNQKSIPDDYFIDHIDGNTTNNSKDNLRLVTSSENMYNRKINKNSKLGLKGIAIWKEKTGLIYYRCQIRKNNKKFVKLFPYTTSGLEHAKIWVREQREQHHGEFGRVK